MQEQSNSYFFNKVFTSHSFDEKDIIIFLSDPSLFIVINQLDNPLREQFAEKLQINYSQIISKKNDLTNIELLIMTALVSNLLIHASQEENDDDVIKYREELSDLYTKLDSNISISEIEKSKIAHMIGTICQLSKNSSLAIEYSKKAIDLIKPSSEENTRLLVSYYEKLISAYQDQAIFDKLQSPLSTLAVDKYLLAIEVINILAKFNHQPVELQIERSNFYYKIMQQHYKLGNNAQTYDFLNKTTLSFLQNLQVITNKSQMVGCLKLLNEIHKFYKKNTKTLSSSIKENPNQLYSMTRKFQHLLDFLKEMEKLAKDKQPLSISQVPTLIDKFSSPVNNGSAFFAKKDVISARADQFLSEIRPSQGPN